VIATVDPYLSMAGLRLPYTRGVLVIRNAVAVGVTTV
jgi:hypothetical protein